MRLFSLTSIGFTLTTLADFGAFAFPLILLRNPNLGLFAEMTTDEHAHF
jgi:hypothetical protein